MSIALSRLGWLGVQLETRATDPVLSLRISRLLIEDRSERPVCELPRPMVATAMDAYRRFDRKVREFAAGAVAGGR